MSEDVIKKPSCTFMDCDRPRRTRLLCQAHYYRLQKYGYPGGGSPLRPMDGKRGRPVRPWWEE